MKKMTKQEKRACRREWISYYLQGNKCIYLGYQDTIWKMVRASESVLFGKGLNIYKANKS